MADKKRTLIIGLDGATWTVLDPLMKMGVMPTLKKLCEEGFRTTLMSTDPPVTAPAWVSFMTGKQPGEHGVFHFVKYDRKQNKLYTTNSTHIEVETMWEILSRHGKRVISLFFPYTYPPYPVNGVMVSGFDTPSMENEFTFPPELRDEIMKKFPGFDIRIPHLINGPADDIEGYIESAIRTVDLRRDVALYILENYPDWDVCGIVVQEVDLFQHYLWNLIVKVCNDSEKNYRIKNIVKEFYRSIDSTINKIIGIAGEGSYMHILSDHGFGEFKGWVYPNVTLWEEGIVKLEFPYNVKAFLNRSNSLLLQWVNEKIIDKIIHKIRAKKKYSENSKRVDQGDKNGHGIHSRINFEQTPFAVLFGDITGFGYIFDLRVTLDDVKKVFVHVKGIKDVVSVKEYFGIERKDFPDFVVILEEGYHASNIIPKLNVSNQVLSHFRGGHRKEGIYIGIPGTVEQKEVSHITHIAPIIFKINDIPLSESKWSFKRDRILFSKEEEKDVLDRLKALGYIE